MIEIRNSEPKLSEDLLQRVEAALGVRFPTDYSKFLLTHNGGKPKHGVFAFESDSNVATSKVRVFYSLGGTSEFYDLQKKAEVFADRIRPPMVSIGCDDGGNQVVICCQGEETCAVYFFDHETDRLHLISTTFAEFLLSLK